MKLPMTWRLLPSYSCTHSDRTNGEKTPQGVLGIGRLPAEGRCQRLDIMTANAEIEGVRSAQANPVAPDFASGLAEERQGNGL